MPLTTEQKDENRELWEAGMLTEMRAHFKIFGDRRNHVDEMYQTVKAYGQGIPLMVCSCGKSMQWEDWPDHWRDKHAI